MLLLKHYTQSFKLDCADERQTVYLMPTGYDLYPINKSHVESVKYHKDTVYVVRFKDPKGDIVDVQIAEADSAYILNESGKTIYTVHKPFNDNHPLKRTGRKKN